MEPREMEMASEEPRDRTKWMWLGLVAIVVLMVGALWLTVQPTDKISIVRAQHILIAANMRDPAERQSALERVREIREQLLAGASFEKLAKEYSNDPATSIRGGDLGWSTHGTYDNTFESYVWHAPIGEIGEILSTGRGFHIIRVLDRRLSSVEEYARQLEERTKQSVIEESQQQANAGTPRTAPAAPSP